MATRTFKIPNGAELTLSSDELEPSDLTLAQVLLELAVEQGRVEVTVSEEELARRLVGVDQAVVSPAAISITAMAPWRSRPNCSGLDEAA
jgi:hypothetical protein